MLESIVVSILVIGITVSVILLIVSAFIEVD